MKAFSKRRKKARVSGSLDSVPCTRWANVSLVFYVALLLFSFALFMVFFYYGVQIHSHYKKGIFKNPKQAIATVQSVDGNYAFVSFRAAEGEYYSRVLVSEQELVAGSSLRIVYDYLEPGSVVSETVYRLSQWVWALLCVSGIALVSLAVAVVMNRVKYRKLLQELEDLELLRGSMKSHKVRVEEEEWQKKYSL